MKTRPFYLVIDTHGTPRAVRVTQRWPTLDTGELTIRVAVEIPESRIPNAGEPYQLIIDDPRAIAVAVEAYPVEPPLDDDEHEDDDDVAA